MKKAENNKKHYRVVRDRLVQAFQFDEEVINSILSREHEGVIRLNGYILINTGDREAEMNNFRYCYAVVQISKIPLTLGFLYWGSNSYIFREVYFKVINERLYDTEVIDLEAIGNSLGLTMNNVPSIDIAVDFDYNVVEMIYDLWKDNNFDVIILDKQRDKNEYISEILNNGKGSLIQPYQYKGFYIKNKDKAHKLHLCAYDKGFEIATESPHKRYIIDHEGLGDKIYRLEVRTTSKALETTLKALNIDKQRFYKDVLNNPEELLKVWEHLFQRLLRFRKRNARTSERFIELATAYSPHKADKGFANGVISRVLSNFTSKRKRQCA